MSVRHFLDLSDFDGKTLNSILDEAKDRKTKRLGQPKGRPDQDRPLDGRVLAMIFEKPSTRTRVSFDVGMRQLGGETLVLSGSDLQLGRGESVADTARVLSRYVDAIMIRTDDHDKLIELAHYATVPVINGLTDKSHPCQLMTDVMTFEEHKGSIKGKVIAWSGDANNMVTSFIHAASRFDFQFNLACPPDFGLDQEVKSWAENEGVRLMITDDPASAVAGADCVVADTWVSMGDDDGATRHNRLQPYQVDEKLMGKAKADAIFMHCLPAHRGEEATTEVLDGPRSVIFDEAENRLHSQKAILTWCLS
jgi:ornithine carbamoyltransferase